MCITVTDGVEDGYKRKTIYVGGKLSTANATANTSAYPLHIS